MKQRHLLLALAVGTCVITLAGCRKEPGEPAGSAAQTAPQGENADQFIARVNEEIRKSYPEISSAQWLSSTYINDDTQRLAAKANERYLTQLNGWIDQARKFEGQKMTPATARAIQLLKLQTSMPAPKDPAKLAELTQISTRMEGMYGAGEYCTGEGDAKQCRQLGALEDVLRSSRDYDKQLDAWQGW
ncbi:MAG: M2 family metallopeptidase, partial [Pseudoxanthomonas sp.]